MSVYGNDDPAAYERIGNSFMAAYGGMCTLDSDHIIKRGTKVSKVQRADNPMLPVSGVACALCIKGMPHA